jgi:glycerate dehydrogenase
MHKLVIVDGVTLNPGDLSWNEFHNLVPVVEIYERTASADVVERCQGASIVLTNKTKLSAETINSLSHLRFIGVLSTGYDVVDIAAASCLGIPVSNVPSYATSSVAQMVFAIILNWTNGIAHHAARVRDGAGEIGQQVGRLAHAFGMRVSAVVRSPKSVEYPVDFVAMEEVFSQSDFLCLLCPLTKDTHSFVNADRIRTMKPTAYLINAARGPLVVEEDLAHALNQAMIAGAATDVLAVEPPSASNPLLHAKNMIITPHQAWATVEARQRLMSVTLGNIRAFLNGAPRNVVNKSQLA